MRTLPCMAVALLAVSACASKPALEKPVPATTSPAAAPAAPAPARAAIGDFGIDLTAGNSHVKPGDDFFAYANGTWAQGFTIPADHASYGPFNTLDDLSKQRVRGIIESAATAHAAAGTPGQQIGDFYASFMDTAAIQTNGLAPAQADLNSIATANNRESIARLFGQPGFASLFDADLPADFHNPDRYALYISESSLGLPDRDYYLKDDAKLKELRAKYVAYIAQMLELAGVSDSAARARAVMAFETAASKVQWPIDKRRDVDRNWNPRTKAQQLIYAPGFAAVPRVPEARRPAGPGAGGTVRGARSRAAVRTHPAADLARLAEVPVSEQPRALSAAALRQRAVCFLRPGDAWPTRAARALEARGR